MHQFECNFMNILHQADDKVLLCCGDTRHFNGYQG